MPDILIRMEMPEIKNNHGIKAELRRIDGRLEIGFMTGGYSCCEQWTYYPIHELPPHWDLIDRSEALKAMEWKWAGKAAFEAVKDVPAIVPSNKEETE